ncbi:MAG: DUF4387 family protein [Pseudomonadota bacterium]
MPELGTIAEKVRSKNAGPFWVTLDIFCGTSDAYKRVRDGLDTADIAARFQTDSARIKRFDMADLNVVKISLPRPVVQGGVRDRDMHGAGWAAVLAEIELP